MSLSLWRDTKGCIWWADGHTALVVRQEMSTEVGAGQWMRSAENCAKYNVASILFSMLTLKVGAVF